MRVEDVIYYLNKIHCEKHDELKDKLDVLEFKALKLASHELEHMNGLQEELDNANEKLRMLAYESENALMGYVTLRQVLLLLINNGIKKCEIWQSAKYRFVKMDSIKKAKKITKMMGNLNCSGTIEEMLKQEDILNNIVVRVYFADLFKNKVIILIDEK